MTCMENPPIQQPGSHSALHADAHTEPAPRLFPSYPTHPLTPTRTSKEPSPDHRNPSTTAQSRQKRPHNPAIPEPNPDPSRGSYTPGPASDTNHAPENERSLGHPRHPVSLPLNSRTSPDPGPSPPTPYPRTTPYTPPPNPHPPFPHLT